VDHANNKGFTALLTAAKECNVACVKILAAQGHASLLHRDKIKNYSVKDWLNHHGYTSKEIMKILPSTRKPIRKFTDAINIARLLPSIKSHKDKRDLAEHSPAMVSRIMMPIAVSEVDIEPRKKRQVTRHRSLENNDQTRFRIKRIQSLQLPDIYRGRYDSPFYESEEESGKRRNYRPHFERCRRHTFDEYYTFESSSDDD
jgi:hypothetical protein